MNNELPRALGAKALGIKTEKTTADHNTLPESQPSAEALWTKAPSPCGGVRTRSASMTTLDRPSGKIDLYWIPLGADGSGFVRLNGRIYEGIKARLEHRRPLALFHTALQVHVPDGRFVVETMWPSPGRGVASRGVVVEGPVFNRRIARLRTFRYEVRRWRSGVIADAEMAAGGPRTVSTELEQAHRLLELTAFIPALTWGRDELQTGEMWNSNSVIAWLLARSGLSVGAIRPPEGGRAPGWAAGLAIARNSTIGSTWPMRVRPEKAAG